MRRPYRDHVGDDFSEGARLVWLAKEADDLSNGDIAEIAGCSRSQILKIIYGDQLPNRRVTERLRDRFGVPATAWDEKPAVPFVVPAARPKPPAAVESSLNVVDADETGEHSAAPAPSTGTDDSS